MYVILRLLCTELKLNVHASYVRSVYVLCTVGNVLVVDFVQWVDFKTGFI